jgi:Predicted metal-dependent membrane protease
LWNIRQVCTNRLELVQSEKGVTLMRKGIFREKQKKLNLLLIVSILSLALLVVSPTAYGSDLSNSPSQTGLVLQPLPANTTGETGFSKLVLVSDENEGPFQKVEQYINLVYTFVGIGAAVLILLIYRYMASKEQELIEKIPKELDLHKAPKEQELIEKIPKELDLHKASKEKELIEKIPKELESHKIWKILGLEKLNQEKYETTRIRLFIAIPAVFIVLAEFFIYIHRIQLAILIHIGILIAFSLSNMFVKDLKVYRIYQALMLLPILRLVNLSMPVFFSTTLYTYVFVYSPLLIPLIIIVTHQRYSLEQVGITAKHILGYTILSIPLGLLLGFGEYLTIRPHYLIPDLSIENLLKLTIIMVLFVGLTEELIFRSILQTRLEEVLGSREALIIASILFGFMHSGYSTFYEIMYTGFVALFIGFAFHKTKSLPFVAILHGLINVFLFGILPYYLSGWAGF